MKSNRIWVFVFIAAWLPVVGCGQKTQRDLIDSLASNSEGVETEKWDPIAPDTAAMRKSLTCVELQTSLGTLTVALFDHTPKHRENFLKLAKSGFYNNVLFHRVINSFMIQTGDPVSKTAKKGQALGEGGPGYTLPREFGDTFFHYRGALSAARTSDEMNPDKESSGSQFFIVTGSPHGSVKIKEAIRNKSIGLFLSNPDHLSYNLRMQTYQGRGDMAAMNVLLQELETAVKPLNDSLFNAIPARTRQMYATWGGYPSLDGEYTVFGFLVAGYDVLDKIQKLKTDGNNRPLEDVAIISAKILEPAVK